MQALNTGQTLADVIPILSADGTTANISISINGTDDIIANLITGTPRCQIIVLQTASGQAMPAIKNHLLGALLASLPDSAP